MPLPEHEHRIVLLAPQYFTVASIAMSILIAFTSMAIIPKTTNEQLRYRWTFCCFGICSILFIHNFVPVILPQHLEERKYDCLWRLTQRHRRGQHDPVFLLSKMETTGSS